MKYEDIKSDIKKDLLTKYFDIKARVKEKIPTKGKAIELAIWGALIVYGAFVVSFGDFNPLTMKKTARQRQIKYAEEQKAELERRKLNKESLENLLKLKKGILKKAENLDGRAGLTFIEQTELARKLGYEGMLLEGRIDNFGLEVD